MIQSYGHKRLTWIFCGSFELDACWVVDILAGGRAATDEVGSDGKDTLGRDSNGIFDIDNDDGTGGDGNWHEGTGGIGESRLWGGDTDKERLEDELNVEETFIPVLEGKAGG